MERLHSVVILTTHLLTVNTLLLAWSLEFAEVGEFSGIKSFGKYVSYVVMGIDI